MGAPVNDPFASGAVGRLDAAVLALPGVTKHPHRWGGEEYRRGDIELGHVHTDGRADVRVGGAERDRLTARKMAEEDYYAPPEDGWVTVRLFSESDERTAAEAFRYAYDAADRPL
jgi:hypothetical protein